MDEDNLFDDDDALDYVLYEECAEERKIGRRQGGCLGMLVFLLILPVTGLLLWRGL